MMAGGAIMCVSKRQRCVTTSTCWAELVALSLVVAETVYVLDVASTMGLVQNTPVTVFVDNEAAKMVSKDPVMHSNMKHVARRHFYAREMEEDGVVTVKHISTEFNLADALTKYLPLARFQWMAAQYRGAGKGGLMGAAEDAVSAAMAWVRGDGTV